MKSNTPRCGPSLALAVLPGDGIGPEISASTSEILQLLNDRMSLGISLETHEIGLASLKREGTTFPAAAAAACRSADGIVLGPVSHAIYPPRAEGGINVSGELRITLDLYANIRPGKAREGLPHWGRTPMDLVIVRENTEGFYADRNMYWGVGEFMPTPDLALAVRKITAADGSRPGIASSAFEALAEEPAEEGHGGAQGKCDGKVSDALVFARGARGREKLSAGRLRGATGGFDGRTAGARRGAIRRGCYHEYVWRHLVR